MKLKISNPLNKKHLRADRRAFSNHNAKKHWLGKGMYSSRQREGRHRYNEPHHIAEANVVHEHIPINEGIPSEILEYLVALRDRAIGVLENRSMEKEPCSACKEPRPTGRGSYFDYISPFDKKRPKDYVIKPKKQLTKRGYTIDYRGAQRGKALAEAKAAGVAEGAAKGYNAAVQEWADEEERRLARRMGTRATIRMRQELANLREGAHIISPPPKARSPYTYVRKNRVFVEPRKLF